METKNFTDFTDTYTCKSCAIICKRKSEWTRHILTRKHILSLSGNLLETNLVTDFTAYVCSICDKKYSTKSGLWKHKKICASDTALNSQTAPDEVKNLTNMVIELMKSNNELQKQML